MKKVMPIKVEIVSAGSPQSELHLQSAYNIIFSLARENIFRKKVEKGRLDSKV